MGLFPHTNILYILVLEFHFGNFFYICSFCFSIEISYFSLIMNIFLFQLLIMVIAATLKSCLLVPISQLFRVDLRFINFLFRGNIFLDLHYVSLLCTLTWILSFLLWVDSGFCSSHSEKCWFPIYLLVSRRLTWLDSNCEPDPVPWAVAHISMWFFNSSS